MGIFIHNSANVSDKAKIGKDTKIWNWVQVRENASIGNNSIISKGVYIDFGVKIGNNVKIQNNVSVYHGVTIEDGVFIGPHVCFTNDKIPRAINPDGKLKDNSDWKVSPIIVKEGASIGANSVILPGVIIGRFALIGSGSVVTKDIPDFALAYGNPAIIVGIVCKCGNKLVDSCNICGMKIKEVKK
jgi:UDP-2-acetamido-3-amino-2,3-dideoxy-glucuronate N-acetyltransferase